jgi:ABC-type antimicrobial peptide transport system permease subunit
VHLSYHLRESLHSLTTNPLRSSLSIVGVVFGVASVVAMLSIGMGAEAEIEKLLSALGAQNVHVTAKDLDDDGWGRVLKSTIGLSERDLGMVESLFGGVPVAKVSEWRSTDVNKPLPGARLEVYGMTANFRSVLGAEVLAGRSFTEREEQLARPVALIGAGLAKLWFGDVAAAIDREVRIDRAWFHVIGVLGGDSAPGSGGKSGKSGAPDGAAGPGAAAGPATGSTTDTAAADAAAAGPAIPSAGGAGGAGPPPELKLLGLGSAVVVPFASGQRRLGPTGPLAALERLVLKLPASVDPIAARKRIEAHAARLHRGAEVVTVTSADEVIEQRRSTTRLFSYFLLTIALISLVVGGIGIANVMLASMVERIREVGLRRAIGAKRRHILWQFLAEALAICLIGGVIGGVAGLGVAWIIGVVTGWSVAFPWWGLAVALVIATVVGTIAGLYPALAAARISPIEALQGRA